MTVRARRVVVNAIGLIVALVWVFPVYWMVSSAFLPNHKLQAPNPTFVPWGGTTANFSAVLQDAGSGFLPALRMSLTVTLVTVCVALLLAFLAALAVSRFRFRGRRSFILIVLVVQMLPAEGLFLSQYKMLDGWNLLNSVLGLSLLYVAAVVPFTIWMLRGFVSGVPIELEEAGMVDGLSRVASFFRITFPLLAPGLVASGVYAFLQAWNEFTLALVVLSRPESTTLPLWLRQFLQANRETEWGQVMAGATLLAIPVVVFFLLVQGRMTAGLVSGAVKG